MPPPLPIDSDAESAAEEKEQPKNEEPTDSKTKDDDEEDDEDEGGEPEEYVVKTILDHHSDFEDGLLRYHVKWLGYDKPSERTWEVEENLDGARELLEAYWKSVGGKPVAGQKRTKKRGRQSSSSAKPETAKKPKTGKKSRKSNGALEQDTTPPPLAGYTEEGEDGWKPPPANKDAWDDKVQCVDTVVRENADGELWGYLIWNEKNADGRFYRTKANLPTIYRAAPQRMLHFYEKHLVFSTTAPEIGTDEADDKGTN